MLVGGSLQARFQSPVEDHLLPEAKKLVFSKNIIPLDMSVLKKQDPQLYAYELQIIRTEASFTKYTKKLIQNLHCAGVTTLPYPHSC